MPSERAGTTGTPWFTSAFLREERGGDQVRDEEVVADFLGGHLPGCRCYRRPVGRGEEPVRRGLGHLLVMLREEGAIPPVVADEPPCQELIEGYRRFPRRDRGLAETTVVNYRRCLRDFLVSRGDAVSPAELVALSADDLLAFGRQRGAGQGRTAWNHLATALPGFYRWLDLCGHGGAQLVGASFGTAQALANAPGNPHQPPATRAVHPHRRACGHRIVTPDARGLSAGDVAALTRPVAPREPAHRLPGASRGTARRRSVPYWGASSPMYLACTVGGPLVYLTGDPGVTVLRAEALARC